MFCPTVKPVNVAVALLPAVLHGLAQVLALIAAIACSRPDSVRFMAEFSQKPRSERLSAVLAIRIYVVMTSAMMAEKIIATIRREPRWRRRERLEYMGIIRVCCGEYTAPKRPGWSPRPRRCRKRRTGSTAGGE